VGDYTFDAMVEDLYQLLRQLNIQSAYFVGQAAIGIGQIFTFFLHHPEMVKGLVAVSFGSFATGINPENQRSTAEMPRGSGGLNHLKQIAQEKGMLAALEERKKTLTLWTPEILDNPEIMSRFEEMYRQAAVPAFVALPERISEQRHKEVAAALQKNPVPVFHVAGVDDVNPTEGLEGLRAISPRYHAVILPDCGHYVAIENPGDFNAAVLNFLAGVQTYG
jgi:pimeloyl-ACP methyl ester carboxylesterase